MTDALSIQTGGITPNEKGRAILTENDGSRANLRHVCRELHLMSEEIFIDASVRIKSSYTPNTRKKTSTVLSPL